MREQEHNYEIYELKKGFKVTPQEETRPPVYATVNKYGFWTVCSKTYDGIHIRKTIPLYGYYELSDCVVDFLYKTWASPRKGEFKSSMHEHKIKNWAKKVTGKTLSKKMHDIWKKKCLSFDPRIETLHRKLYSVSNGTGNWTYVENIIKNKEQYNYLIDDLLKYHGARIAVLHGANVTNTQYYYGLYDINIDWKKAYTDDCDTYTSLNKTLMNLPYGITYHLLFNLKTGKLPQPATTRIRLWAYCMLYERAYRNMSDRENVILRSTDDDIKNAIRYMWRYFPIGHETFRGSRGIKHALGLIFDYPFDIGKWNILGLAKRSEEYHHNENVRRQLITEQYEQQKKLNAEKWSEIQKKLEVTKTALPPISLPENKNIKFLDTYNDVQIEGIVMKHCIAQYAEQAIKGDSFLFHVDHEGESASVEVSAGGFVKQSYGPRDTTNRASEYGKQELSKWAKNFNRKSPVIRCDKELLNLHIPARLGIIGEEIPFLPARLGIIEEEIPF